MTEQFNGAWQLVSSEGFDEYMRCVGVGFPTRKIADMLKPDVIFSRKGDDCCLRTESTWKNTQLDFVLGVEFDETTADNRKCKTVITLENGALVQVQKWDGKATTIKREVKNGQLIVTCIMDEAKCTRIYDKK
ncbi:myelin P2 protein-like [Rhinatrema bivittatum]|uniref:myelin P2 protein-like n=1 Tax=Rhinatrema bivittatum TaxID=194408 RepID=UPI0011261DCA|nr:myelin P2 protein-like [Rhinatrema bivittatum]